MIFCTLDKLKGVLEMGMLKKNKCHKVELDQKQDTDGFETFQEFCAGVAGCFKFILCQYL